MFAVVLPAGFMNDQFFPLPVALRSLLLQPDVLAHTFTLPEIAKFTVDPLIVALKGETADEQYNFRVVDGIAPLATVAM